MKRLKEYLKEADPVARNLIVSPTATTPPTAPPESAPFNLPAIPEPPPAAPKKPQQIGFRQIMTTLDMLNAQVKYVADYYEGKDPGEAPNPDDWTHSTADVGGNFGEGKHFESVTEDPELARWLKIAGLK